LIQCPVVRSVAVVLYSKLSCRSAPRSPGPLLAVEGDGKARDRLPVLLVKQAPKLGSGCRSAGRPGAPRARRGAIAVVSPWCWPGCRRRYCSLSRAPPPVSVMNQPGIARVLVVLRPYWRACRSSGWSGPRVVRLTHWRGTDRAQQRKHQDNARMSARNDNRQTVEHRNSLREPTTIAGSY